ncbi:uncharacterized protein LOC9629350 [Selaginella moellendorffii]|uniref:uncharacterized protein LOC9629350 n=1 Tax=Selaginella moellendorffii TaxID=88036 RepID=UPI000D1C8CF4|nr:uncharacterized protein LOC9629350 [Selaginella moellendorffii]|eukprot:XP_024519530.1 uncharacterized protein LOC9629350 [Selaginella moellendorffii]
MAMEARWRTVLVLQQRWRGNRMRRCAETLTRYVVVPEDSALISGAVEAPLHPVHAAQFTTASDMWSAEERKDERRLTQLEASKRALEGINEPGGICKHCDGRVSVISGLEQAVQQLKDRLHTFEVKHDNVSQMGKQVQEMEETSDALARACREEQRQRQMCKALESEVCDLRALLRAVEQTSAEAELRHLNTVSALVKVVYTRGACHPL